MEENNVEKNQLFQKKWFFPVLITLIVLSNLIVAIIFIMPQNALKTTATIATQKGKNQTINLKNLKLGNILNKLPRNNKGYVATNTENRLLLYITNMTPQNYNEYINQCRQIFNYDEKIVDKSFEAYDKENNKIELEYNEKRKMLKIEVTTPSKLKEIKWPNTDIVQMLPKPKSIYGSIYKTNSREIDVYVENTSKEEYIEYVEKCKLSGYNIRIEQTENKFAAQDTKGNTIKVKYQSGREMEIILQKRVTITSSNNVEKQVNKISTNNT